MEELDLTPMKYNFIGSILSLLFLGIVIAQSVFYFSRGYRDEYWVKILVLGLLALNIVESVFDTLHQYHVLIKDFGNFSLVYSPDKLLRPGPAMIAVSAVLVQLFFVRRVQILGKKAWITAAIVVVILCGFACAIVFSVVLADGHDGDKLSKVWSTSWALCACAADWMITIVLVVSLKKHRNLQESTTRLLNRLTYGTVQTGFMTSTWSFANAILYLTQNKGYHLITCKPLAKVYTICLLASLNSRASPSERSGRQKIRGGSDLVSDIRFMNSGGNLKKDTVISISNLESRTSTSVSTPSDLSCIDMPKDFPVDGELDSEISHATRVDVVSNKCTVYHNRSWSNVV